MLRPFYERLIAKGKPPKVALIAVLRRLVVFANAVLRSGQPWKCHHLTINTVDPGSAKRHEERCTASGTREVTLKGCLLRRCLLNSVICCV